MQPRPPRKTVDGFVPRRPAPVVRRPLSAAPARPAVRPHPRRTLPTGQVMGADFIMTPMPEPIVHQPAPQLVRTPQPQAEPRLVEKIYTQPYPKPKPVAKPAAPPPAAKKRLPSWLGTVLSIAQYPLFGAIAIAASYSTKIGQWFVLAYVIYAIIRRQNSRLTFGLAVFLLLAIPIFQVLQQTHVVENVGGVAENTAVYVFELLVFGTLQAMIEVYFASRKKHSTI